MTRSVIQLSGSQILTRMEAITKPFENITKWIQQPWKQQKSIFRLNEASEEDWKLLSTKGANLCEIKRQGFSVPPAFILSTDTSLAYKIDSELIFHVMEEVRRHVAELEKSTGRVFGSHSGQPPLLLSVRVGSSMKYPHVTEDLLSSDIFNPSLPSVLLMPESWSSPGVQESILGIGMTGLVLEHLSALTSRRFALNTYAHFLVRFGTNVCGVPSSGYHQILADYFIEVGRSGNDLTADDLAVIVDRFKMLSSIPEDPFQQLKLALCSAYKLWFSDASVSLRYDGLECSEDVGVAIIVQSMVYGGIGSVFSRNPVTGEKENCGDYWSEEGNKLSIQDLCTFETDLWRELQTLLIKLETVFKDMVFVEYVVDENGTINILSAVAGTRSSKASVKIAVDLSTDGIVSEREAVCLIDTTKLKSLYQQPVNAISFGEGVTASQGFTCGTLTFDPLSMLKSETFDSTRKFVLCVESDTIMDPKTLKRASAIIALRGDLMSPIIVLCRSLGIPTIVNLELCSIHHPLDGKKSLVHSGKLDLPIFEGQNLIVDCHESKGKILLGEGHQISWLWEPDFVTLLNWSNFFRRIDPILTIQGANAAAQLTTKRYQVGNTGVFVFSDWLINNETRERLLWSILLDSPDKEQSIETLTTLMKDDLASIFHHFNGLPVVVSLFNQSIDRFFPSDQEIPFLAVKLNVAVPILQNFVSDFKSSDSLLGIRGSRVCQIFQSLTEIQISSIIDAQLNVFEQGVNVRPQIVVPAVSNSREFKTILDLIHATAFQRYSSTMRDSDLAMTYSNYYTVGIMIDNPRICLRADSIAQDVSFVYFNTTALTSLTFGMDSNNSGFLPQYLSASLLLGDPFQSIDDLGVGQLISLAIEKIRPHNPNVRFGIVGNQLDLRSIKYFQSIGVQNLGCNQEQFHLVTIRSAQANIQNPPQTL